MISLKKFLADEDGFTGAEKALITLLGLGIVIVVAKYILSGSTAAGTTSQESLTKAKVPDPVTYTEPSK